MNKSKPMFFVLFAVLAFAMSGCGKSNGSAAVPPVAAGQYGNGAYGYPSGQYGALSGIIASYQGTVYMDSANIQSFQGPSYQCPGVENFTANPLMGNGSDGQILVYGSRQNCAAQVQIQISLSQLVVQDIMYKTRGMAVGSAIITRISVGRYGNTVYGGQVEIMVNGSFPYVLYF